MPGAFRIAAVVRVSLGAGLLLGTGSCLTGVPFECATDTQCTADGTRGVCEPTGFCSLPDASCLSGRRYDDSAVGGLSGSCVVRGCFLTLAASSTHTCGVVQGRAQCWGANGRGQLGNGNQTDSDAPGSVSLLTDVRNIDVGSNFSCAVSDATTAHCWGAGDAGQLGNAAFEDAAAPQRVDTEDCGDPLVSVSAGDAHACGITNERDVCCWGESDSGRLGGSVGGLLSKGRPVAGLPTVARVSSGGAHTCAIDTGDNLWCWGDNSSGQLGTGGSPISSAQPLMVGLAGVHDVSTGDNHTCAVTFDDKLHCWGADTNGQLGDGSAGDMSQSPAQVDLEQVASVSAGSRHTCARLADHRVMCWGFGADGQLGDGSASSASSPTEVAGVGDAYDLVVGDVHSCAVQGDGVAVCWGANANGELGAAGTVDFGTPSPTPVTVSLDSCGG